jgi:hypothetical protein
MVMLVVWMQPVGKVYVMDAVPAAIPVSTPVAALIDAMPGSDELHEPPGAALLKVAVAFSQTTPLPVMVPGKGFTVTTADAKQPVDSAYVIVLVPAEAPVTSPMLPIVATAGVLLLHVPPAVTSDCNVERPEHTCAIPVTGAGNGLTVISAVLRQPVDSV